MKVDSTTLSSKTFMETWVANRYQPLGSYITGIGVLKDGTAIGTETKIDVQDSTGIVVTSTDDPTNHRVKINIRNSAPDQTVSLSNGTGISATGTYPSFTITNTAPDQTVSLSNGTGISVTGTYPSFTITNSAPSLGGTVYSIATTSPITGGTITGSGTIAYNTDSLAAMARRHDTINLFLSRVRAGHDYQPLNAKLTAIGTLSNSAGWLHNDGAGGFAYSTPTGTDTTKVPFKYSPLGNIVQRDTTKKVVIGGKITGDAQSSLSVQGNQLSQLKGGDYFGKVGVRENQWYLSNCGVNWKQTAFLASALGPIVMSSDGKYQLEAVDNNGYIYYSVDYGASWTQSNSLQKYWSQLAISADGKICSATDDNNGYIYYSTNYGVDWAKSNSLQKYWTGIAMSSDGKIQTALANYSYIYCSIDYGVNWTVSNSASQDFWNRVAMSSDGKIQSVTVAFDYIYCSTDYGKNWIKSNSLLKNWTNIKMSSDGKIQSACEITTGLVYYSTNYGLDWTASNAPSKNWYGLAVSASGQIQSVSGAPANSYHIYNSVDYGVTWMASNSPSTTWEEVAMSSDGKVQTAGTSDGYMYVSYATSNIKGDVAVGDTLTIGTIPTYGSTPTYALVPGAGNAVNKYAWPTSGVISDSVPFVYNAARHSIYPRAYSTARLTLGDKYTTANINRKLHIYGSMDVKDTLWWNTHRINESGDGLETDSYFYSGYLVSGGLTNNGGVLDIPDSVRFSDYLALNPISAPAKTTNKLYNVGGSLYWHGSAIAGGATPALDNLASVAMNAPLQWNNSAARTLNIAATANTVVGRALTISAGSTVTGGTADMDGGDLTLASGLGKGKGASSIHFSTGTTLTTGSTLQTLSEKMTILGNGNVGIGTTRPEAPLHVNGKIIAGAGATNTYYGLPPVGDMGLVVGSNTATAINTGSVLGLAGRPWSSDTRQVYWGSIAGLKETSTDNQFDGYMAFYTSQDCIGEPYTSEKMRITSNGNVGIGSLAGTGTRAVLAAADGTLSAPVSDERLKKNITPLKLDFLGMLKDDTIHAINFNWKDTARGKDTELGFTYQMFEPYHIKGLTFFDKGIGGINYEKITAILWEQNRALLKKQEALEERLNILEARIEKLEKK